jgi:hypothetical protein
MVVAVRTLPLSAITKSLEEKGAFMAVPTKWAVRGLLVKAVSPPSWR